MSDDRSRFDSFLADELQRYKGVAVPVRASGLRRLLARKLPIRKLHPNPDDEFCLAGIGPNYGIISEYMQMYRHYQSEGVHTVETNTYVSLVERDVKEPLIVEKIRPSGYMILNGHHRWAAAYRLGMKRVRTKVVNLTHEADVRRYLSKSTHQRRVAFDLDEVVFNAKRGETAEKRLPLPLSLRYTEPLRLGIPALFRFLDKKGYDVWVYTARYESDEHVRHFFLAYHAPVTGVITGVNRKAAGDREKMEQSLKSQYTETVHIDGDTVLRVFADTGCFEEYTCSGEASSWSREMMDIVGAFKYDES